MRLKSLELHGYKTFASQTVFEFAGMVTAVVGPNGSGKSNVADSLRWVLGEQSYSLLRGKKTEDMIFSGSEQRPRAGMASVVVTFDNSQGWLPIDFSEVSITRRAYRDGQNEYLINGQRVRLKDVSELLAQSGLAERTYTIIGQGVVDAALSLKAEERRRLFEEAAGIGLYRSRREEAIRRLETTQRNLERVQDILAELQPRLNSLERQARRAREYEQVRADLRLLLREWYGYHWHQSQRDLTESRDQARKQEDILEKVRRNYLQLDEQMSQSRRQLIELRTHLNEWHRQMAGLHTRREDLSTQRAVEDERLRSLLVSHHSTQSDHVRLGEELELDQERLRQAEAEVGQVEAELNEARQQAESAQQSLAGRLGERRDVENDVQKARQKMENLNRQQGELRARLVERQTLVDRQTAELGETQAALENISSQLLPAEGRLKAVEASRDQALVLRGQAVKAHQLHHQKRLEAETARDAILDKIHGLSSVQARLHAQLDVLEQAENALSGYARGAQALLQAARKGQLHGARGALGSLLDVPAELEAAIAAALGEYLDALVLERLDGIDASLSVLQQETVRGVLLPLDAISPPQDISSAKAGEGLFGVASRLVNAPEELRPALDLLLGRTWIVSDREAARRLLKERNGVEGLRAVTLQGEVFHASGPVLSGGEVAQATLSRPRERKALQAEIDSAGQQQDRLHDGLHQVEEEIRGLLLEEKGLEQSVNAAQSAESAAQSAHNQVSLAVEALRKQTSWHMDRQSRLQEDIHQAAGEATRAQESLNQLDQQIAQLREELRRLDGRLGELSLEEFQSQAAFWNTQVAVAQRAVADAQSRLGERAAVLEHARQALNGAQSRLDEIEAALISLEASKPGKRQSESEVTAQIESLRILIEPAEAELDEMEHQQDEVQAKEAAARQELSKAEHHHAQAKIALARRQEALETWRRRIEDDFGLVAFEYTEEVSGPTPLPMDGLVELLPRVRQISPELEENMRRLRAQLRRMGAINPEAQEEFHEVKQRFEFMTEQVSDLGQAEADVHKVIAELDELMQRELRRTFEAVAEEFSGLFTRLFGGGSARLMLTDPEDMTNTGIDIEARLPGKRMQGLSLLSGGERSLTATALIFALLKVSPTPFCLLDEVDAMLDEANVSRFRELLRELSQQTQFIVVTHNRSTVQAADVIYGVTMGRDSTSQVISLKIDEVEKVVD